MAKGVAQCGAHGPGGWFLTSDSCTGENQACMHTHAHAHTHTHTCTKGSFAHSLCVAVGTKRLKTLMRTQQVGRAAAAQMHTSMGWATDSWQPQTTASDNNMCDNQNDEVSDKTQRWRPTGGLCLAVRELRIPASAHSNKKSTGASHAQHAPAHTLTSPPPAAPPAKYVPASNNNKGAAPAGIERA